MKANVFAPVGKNEFVVAVDSTQNSMSGRIYHRSLVEGVLFNGVPELALCVEDVLDSMNEPNSSSESQPFVSAGSLEREHGAIATFRMEVMFRQHCSWQGKVSWLEKGMDANFRSFLDLVLLMYDILANDAATRQKAC